MARLARVVVAGHPHHITQRGNRRQRTFFGDGDYAAYLELVAEWCQRHGVAIWAYCLMPNHVHLVAVPHTPDGLARGIGEAHRRYTRAVNFRENWRGYLWQGRFASFVLQKKHILAAVRYVSSGNTTLISPASWVSVPAGSGIRPVVVLAEERRPAAVAAAYPPVFLAGCVT